MSPNSASHMLRSLARTDFLGFPARQFLCSFCSSSISTVPVARNKLCLFHTVEVPFLGQCLWGFSKQGTRETLAWTEDTQGSVMSQDPAKQICESWASLWTSSCAMGAGLASPTWHSDSVHSCLSPGFVSASLYCIQIQTDSASILYWFGRFVSTTKYHLAGSNLWTRWIKKAKG